ncbi:MAG: hypothetical protein AAF497_04430 [Planctomycetota bacterium]
MKKRRLQISLRLILIATTLLCVYLALDVRYRKLRESVTLVEELGGSVTYHPTILRFVPRVGYLADVRSVQLSHTAVSTEQIKLLPQFKRLEGLYLARTRLTKDDLEIIGGLRGLRRLALWGTKIKSDDLQHLTGLQELRLLDIHANRLLDEKALSWVAELGGLEKLIMDPLYLTDEGCRQLARMPKVNVGRIRLIGATSEGLESLAKIQPGNFTITGIKDSLLHQQSLLSLRGRDGFLPVGPEIEVKQSLLTKRVVDRFPWESLAAVRFSDAGVTFDHVIEHITPRKPKGLVAGENTRISDKWNTQPGGAWGPAGRIITLSDTHVSSLTAEQLGQLPDIEVVHLLSESPLGDFLVHLRDLRIKRLYVGRAPDGKKLFEQIGQLKGLEELTISIPHKKVDLKPLAGLKNLKELHAHTSPVDDSDLEVVASLPKLEKLTLNRADGVSGQGLRHLLELKQLKKLRLRSQNDWNDSMDVLLKLVAQVEDVRLVDVALDKKNLERFRAAGGSHHKIFPLQISR